jgi:CRISPR-associated exonuclease Cas4
MKPLEFRDTEIRGRKHPAIDQVQIINNQTNFPISWLNTQGYCEYSLYLENFQHIKVKANKAMLRGTKVHNKLEENFKKDAVVKPLDEIISTSKTQEVLSREFFVMSESYGIRGYIDEIWLTPDSIVIIDDKPGSRAYYSMIHQVYAYCLAYKDSIGDDRKIEGALRTRGTDNIFWRHEFDEKAENEIIDLVKHVQNLIAGEDDFIPTTNPNKCRACRFNNACPNAQ